MLNCKIERLYVDVQEKTKQKTDKKTHRCYPKAYTGHFEKALFKWNILCYRNIVIEEGNYEHGNSHSKGKTNKGIFQKKIRKDQKEHREHICTSRINNFVDRLRIVNIISIRTVFVS